MINISITDHATPQVNAFIAGMKTRRPLHQAIGARVREKVREHVTKLSYERHATAGKLGATPSGFLGKAARAVDSRKPVVEADGVSILLPHPAFARAFGDVTITPKSGLYLTLPLIAQAYNQRAYRVKGLFFYKSKSGKNFLAKSIKAAGTKGTLVLWYLLVTSVTQREDRALLPADAELLAAAGKGIEDYRDLLLAQKGAAS